ncbi:hypothetical protein [uncultured Amnibacterium sp.]
MHQDLDLTVGLLVRLPGEQQIAAGRRRLVSKVRDVICAQRRVDLIAAR